MSRENVELVRRVNAAWNDDNYDAWLAEIDPDVVWHTAFERALEGRTSTYRGDDGMRKAWEEYRGGAIRRARAQIQELRDLGESVLLLGHLNVTGQGTGIELSQEYGQLCRFRAGRIVSSHDFLSHAQALEAAGLSE